MGRPAFELVSRVHLIYLPFNFIPDLGRGFTSNGRANTATIFDLKT